MPEFYASDSFPFIRLDLLGRSNTGLEISTKGDTELGKKLSAFNLKLTDSNGRTHPIESVFQSSKVFDGNVQYVDLLKKSAYEAKTDPRLRNSGSIIGFRYDGQSFPNKPRTLFYNWIYIQALRENDDLARQLLNYNSFTDCMFVPKKSLNCQANAAALYVGLTRAGLLEEALSSVDNFKRICYQAVYLEPSETGCKLAFGEATKQVECDVPAFVGDKVLLSTIAGMLALKRKCNVVISASASHFDKKCDCAHALYETLCKSMYSVRIM